ncbi:MFS transporter [Amycolatopsis dongchuanensis]|uniref:MFS transporter n=1 Tax=Amycolatopsis dongchuanensis TaxID=1070866 RepID=A0ABP8VJP8_9PSEU
MRRLPPGTRPLAVAVFANAIGTGLVLTALALFLARAAGLPSGRVAVVLSVAGFAGLAAGIPLGRLADVLGARRTTRIMLVCRAGATLAFAFTSSFPLLVVVTTAVTVTERGGNAAIGALIARVGGAARVTVRAYLRSVANLGVALGAGLAGVAIAGSSYALLMAGSAVLVAVAGVLLRWVPAPPAPPAPPATRTWVALRNRRYLAVTALHGVLSLHFDVLAVALPLWIVFLGTVPPWTVSVLVVVNTVIVVLCQVPASRRIDTVRRAARVGPRIGAVFLVACLVFGVTRYLVLPPAALVAVLVAGVVVLSVGELWQTASSFTLGFDLADEHAQGQYQAVFGLGRGLTKAVAPVLLTGLCLGLGLPGWVLLGLGLLGCGVLLVRVVPSGEAVAEPPVGPPG